MKKLNTETIIKFVSENAKNNASTVIKLLKKHNKPVSGLSSLALSRDTIKAFKDPMFAKEYLASAIDSSFSYGNPFDPQLDFDLTLPSDYGSGSSGGTGVGNFLRSDNFNTLLGGLVDFGTNWFASDRQKELIDAKLELEQANNQTEIDLANKRIELAKLELLKSNEKEFAPEQSNLLGNEPIQSSVCGKSNLIVIGLSIISLFLLTKIKIND
jgi:hypothetical protein